MLVLSSAHPASFLPFLCHSLLQAIGEPPLVLATSVFFAIKDALYAARADAGVDGIFQLDCPATVDRIRMACVDQFTKQVISASFRGLRARAVYVQRNGIENLKS